MRHRFPRVRSTTFVAAALLSLLLATACSGAGSPTPSPGLTVVAVGRDLSPTTSRLPVALLLQGNDGPKRIVDSAERIRLAYGQLDGESFTGVTDLTWHAWPVSGGVYVFDPNFTQPGIWEITAELDEDGVTYGGSTFVTVAARSSTVETGQPAPPSVTKTGATTEELRQITSAANPDPALYSMTVAQAVGSGRPSIIAFSTPAFCQTATCGPQLEVISDLRNQYGDRANFVHVEVWDNPLEMLETGDPSVAVIAPAVDEWGLVTEPWTFLIDADGVVFAKFEAFTTIAELTSAIESLLAGD